MTGRESQIVLPPGRWLTAALVAVAMVASTTVAPSSTAPADEGSSSLPGAFAKPMPETIADLKAIEDHVADLVKEVRAGTVGVRVKRAFGSGVIISPDGYVLTAGHVSGKPGRTAEVTLADGRTVAAMTLGQNITADSGLMKLLGDRTDWPYHPMAEPTSVGRGDWCLVLGHPGGARPDRPAVVRLGRVLFSGEDLLQTDCELVGGDSGGPLFDMHGRVIGINSRIAESADMNFHVPVATYHDEWDRLVAGDSFSDETSEGSSAGPGHSGAVLGVRGERNYGSPGVRVTEVTEGDPAGFAGVRVGDVILRFQEQPVRDFPELIELVGRERPGTQARVELRRGGTVIVLRVRLGSLDDE